MVRIRLRRIGAKKKPVYRIVIARQQNSRDGRFIEIVGTYDPHAQTEGVNLNRERIAHWLSVGAQPSDAVARMLRNDGLLDENNKPVALEAITEEGLDESAHATPETAATSEEPSQENAVAA